MKKITFFIFAFFLHCELAAAVYREPTMQFKPKIEVAALFIEEEDRVLLLHRQENKSHGNTWAIPGGKLDSGETPLQAILREAKEETGFDFSDQQVVHLESVFVEHNEKDHFVYHMFRTKMDFDPSAVKIDFKEHKGFTWVTPQDALKMNLMPDEDTCFKMVYQLNN